MAEELHVIITTKEDIDGIRVTGEAFIVTRRRPNANENPARTITKYSNTRSEATIRCFVGVFQGLCLSVG